MADVKNVLIIGVGSIGQRHLRCFQATGRVRASICEVNAELREQVARTQGIDRAYAGLDEALADRPDAAVVTTPAHLHVPMAIQAAEAGAHLLVEKPLGTNLVGLERLAVIVRQRRLTAAVAYVQRANPIFQAMREAIVAGRFGPPVQVVVVSGQHFPTYRPAYRTIYYRDRATGGGAIQDALTHLVNLAEWLVGPAERVLADASHQVLEGVEVEDTVHLLSRHGPVMASFALNQHQAPNETAVTVVCRRGTARYEPFLNRWRWMDKPEEPWHDQCAEPVERDAMFLRQAESFLAAIDGRAAPLCSLDEGIQSLRVNLAALTSCRSGAWQTIERQCS
jgi:predicted dehydrogenase